MTTTKLTVTTEIDLDVKVTAKWFAELSDDEQAEFFIEAARIMSAWPHGMDNQLYYIGGHLRHCPCSTDEARTMITNLAHWVEKSEHRP